MTEEENDVREFMAKAGQKLPKRPTMPSAKIRELRIRLIAEELLELCAALDINLTLDRLKGSSHTLRVHASEDPQTDLTEAYDAVLDLLVVTIGAGIALGTKLQPGWNEVHRTNMAKFAPGGYRREDGKWCKPDNWTPPDLAAIIRAMTRTESLGQSE